MMRILNYIAIILTVFAAVESVIADPECTVSRDSTNGGYKADCSSRGIFHIPENLPGSTTELLLRNNNISELHALNRYRKLIKLDLSFNQIADIEADTFQHLANLHELDLRGNYFTFCSNTSYQDLMKRLARVRKLSVETAEGYVAEGERYLCPSGELNYLTNLEQIRIRFSTNRNNYLRSSDLDVFRLSPAIGTLNSLHHLFLYNIQSYYLQDDSFSALRTNNSSIEGLAIIESKITTIQSKTFDNLPRLKLLNLSANKFITLEGAVIALKDLSGSPIQHLTLDDFKIEQNYILNNSTFCNYIGDNIQSLTVRASTFELGLALPAIFKCFKKLKAVSAAYSGIDLRNWYGFPWDQRLFTKHQEYPHKAWYLDLNEILSPSIEVFDSTEIGSVGNAIHLYRKMFVFCDLQSFDACDLDMDDYFPKPRHPINSKCYNKTEDIDDDPKEFLRKQLKALPKNISRLYAKFVNLPLNLRHFKYSGQLFQTAITPDPYLGDGIPMEIMQGCLHSIDFSGTDIGSIKDWIWDTMDTVWIPQGPKILDLTLCNVDETRLMWNLLKNAEILILAKNKIGSKTGTVPTVGIQFLKSLRLLDLSHNEIRFLEPNIFANAPNLKLIDLSYNLLNISQLSNIIIAIKTHNRNVTIRFEGNNMTCSCTLLKEIQLLKDFIQTHNPHGSYHCLWNGRTIHLNLHDVDWECKENQRTIMTSVLSSIFITLMILVAVILLVRNYWTNLVLFYYMTKSLTKKDWLNTDDCQYNAYIVYNSESQEDADFVRNILMRKVETEWKYKVFYEPRDNMQVGIPKLEAIPENLKKCQCVIVLFSDNLLKGENAAWMKFTLECVLARPRIGARSPFITIHLGNPPQRTKIPKEIRPLLRPFALFPFPVIRWNAQGQNKGFWGRLWRFLRSWTY